jgi:RNA polymerase sigma-70 factor, ECF subfamily
VASTNTLLKNYLEQDLVIKLRDGDIKAFEELYFRYVNRLLAFTQVYIKDKHQSEEIVQEVFIKIWEKRNLLDESQSFKGYLFKSVKNHILNKFRNKIRETGLEEIQESPAFSRNFTEERINFFDMEHLAQETINCLPAVQRNIFKLSRIEHLNNEDISQKLNISKRTVEHHIYLALKALKKALIPLK